MENDNGHYINNLGERWMEMNNELVKIKTA
jgi:hypothetical protein